MKLKSAGTRFKTQSMPLQPPIHLQGRTCPKSFLKNKSLIIPKAGLSSKEVCNKVACFSRSNQHRSMDLPWVLASRINLLRSTVLRKRSKMKKKRARFKQVELNRNSFFRARIVSRMAGWLKHFGHIRRLMSRHIRSIQSRRRSLSRVLGL